MTMINARAMSRTCNPSVSQGKPGMAMTIIGRKGLKAKLCQAIGVLIKLPSICPYGHAQSPKQDEENVRIHGKGAPRCEQVQASHRGEDGRGPRGNGCGN